jgi:hypothetical protein
MLRFLLNGKFIGAIVVLIVIAVIATLAFAPPQPDDIASSQLGGLAVDVLTAPTRIEAYRFAKSKTDVASGIGDVQNPFPKYPLADHVSSVSTRQVRGLLTSLFQGSNYTTDGAAEFEPDLAYRFWGKNGNFADVLISLRLSKVVVMPYSTSTSSPNEIWLSRVLDPADLAASAYSTFPVSKRSADGSIATTTHI